MPEWQLLMQQLLTQWITAFSRLSLDVTHDVSSVGLSLSGQSSGLFHLPSVSVTGLLEQHSFTNKTTILLKRNPHPLRLTNERHAHLVGRPSIGGKNGRLFLPRGVHVDMCGLRGFESL